MMNAYIRKLFFSLFFIVMSSYCDGPLAQECFFPTNEQCLCAAGALADNALSQLCNANSLIDLFHIFDNQIIANLSSIDQITKETLSKETILENTFSMIDLKVSALIESTMDNITANNAIISQIDALQNTYNTQLIPAANSILIDASRLDTTVHNISAAFIGCPPVPITTPVTISSPGNYILCANITGNVTIAANDVELNMAGFRITNLGGTALTINGNERIVIFNGTVSGDTGIGLASGAAAVTITDIQARECTTTGITGTNVSKINLRNCAASGAVTGLQLDTSTSCVIKECDFTENNVGISFTTVSNITVEECTINQSAVTGVALVTSTNNSFLNTKVASVGNSATTDSIYGFISNNGSGNIFENCNAQAIQTGATADGTIAAGFVLTGSESCSKIIGCMSSNILTSSQGQATPYGILLTNVVDSLATVTQAQTAAVVNAVAWSPDARYLAVVGERAGSGTINDPYVTLWLYYFDTVLNQLILVDTQDHGATVYSVSWSTDQAYIAIGGERTSNGPCTPFPITHHIYSFDPFAQTLTEVDHADYGDTVYTVAFSPFIINTPQYLAVGGNVTGGVSVKLYNFNICLDQLSLATTATHGATIRSVSWSADNAYLAIAGDQASGITHRIYTLTTNPTTLTQVANASFGANLNAIAFANEGLTNYCYLAVGGASNGSETTAIYTFTKSPAALAITTATADHGATVNSISWAQNDNYLATGGASGTGSNTHRIYSFVRTPAATLTLQTSANNTATVNGVSWSPDGRMLAVGGNIPADNNTVKIQRALIFPQNNIITQNTVSCVNSNASCPRGVGINGSSIANLITANLVYNTVSPYQFVTNIFDGTSDGIPSPLQNVFFQSNTPIVDQSNPLTTAQQIASLVTASSFGTTINNMLNRACDMMTQFDLPATTIINNSQSIADAISASPCRSIPITAPITINTSGIYCLANTVTTGSIVINQNDVVLDLNGYRLQNSTDGGVVVNASMSWVTIKNGIIGPVLTDAIQINSGCFGITIDNVTARQSVRGANISNASHVTITNSDFSLNSTGIEATSSSKIVVDYCTLQRNTNAGLSFVTSSSNVVTNSIALENGVGSLDGSYGFISRNGSANIFEHCIAEATTTSTTNYNTQVAGFALTGSEMCSKIIGCESGNTSAPFTTSIILTNTVVITPSAFGIWLEERMQLTDTTSQVTSSALTTTGARGVNWSPDGKFIVTADSTANTLSLYSFDRAALTLTRLQTVTVNTTPTFVRWSPNGKYVATVNNGANTVQLLTFNPGTSLLTLVGTTSTGTAPTELDWSPNNKYVVVSNANDDTIQVFTLNPSTNQLIANTAITAGNNPISVRWSPDSKYVACANLLDTSIQIFTFAPSTAELLTANSARLTSPQQPRSLTWTGNGAYLAASFNNTTGIGSTRVFQFDTTQATLLRPFASQTTAVTGSHGQFSTQWSPNSKYLAITESFSAGADFNQIIVFAYTPTQADLLSQTALFTCNTRPECLDWSPDGGYLAVVCSTSGTLQIFSAFAFPTTNVIVDNIAWCTNAGEGLQQYGVGISGNSISNLIMNNISYNNLLNYNFVTIPFTQTLDGNGMPSPVQNVSALQNEPIINPDNVYLGLECLLDLYIAMNSKLDLILTKTFTGH